MVEKILKSVNFVKKFVFNTKTTIIENFEINQDISKNYFFGFIIDQNGDFISFGQNTWGQLGTGNRIPRNHEYKIEILSRLNIVALFEGKFCMFALTYIGQVFAWGANHWGQLGIGYISKPDTYFKPTKVKFVHNSIEFKIVDIKCGSMHNLALTSDHKVFAWGSNRYDQIEKSVNKSLIYDRPKLISADLNVKNIYCHSCSSFLITEKDFIYFNGLDSWGIQNSHFEVENTILLPFKGKLIIANDYSIFYLKQKYDRLFIYELYEYKHGQCIKKAETNISEDYTEKKSTFNELMNKLEFMSKTYFSTNKFFGFDIYLTEILIWNKYPRIRAHSIRYEKLIKLLIEIEYQTSNFINNFPEVSTISRVISESDIRMNLLPWKYLWIEAYEIIYGQNCDFRHIFIPLLHKLIIYNPDESNHS